MDEDETMYEHEDPLEAYDILAEASKIAQEAEERALKPITPPRCTRCHDSFLTVEDRYGICRQCVLENRA